MSGSRRPALLAPVLWLSDRVRTSTRLAVLVVVLLVPGLGATGPLRIGVAGGLQFVVGELHDLSSGGLRCYANGHVPVRSGDTVSVELTLDGQPLKLHSQVMHCVAHGSQTELGLQFLAPPAEVAERIRRFMDAAA